MVTYRRYEDSASYYKVLYFDTFNKSLPAILLIISILSIRRKFRSSRARGFYAREKIVVVHFAIFFSYLILYVVFIILFSNWLRSTEGSMDYCRFLYAEWYFNLFEIIANILTLTLFVKMSVDFSRPLNGYWKEFLLSYRKQSLGEAIQARAGLTVEEKAKRLHEATVRDADH
jgi:magnesium-transporting ATPase (P-type)